MFCEFIRVLLNLGHLPSVLPESDGPAMISTSSS